jgi:legumain
MQYWKAREGSTRKAEAGMDLVRTINHRMHLDKSMDLIGKLLFGTENGPSRLSAVRPRGQVSVDDWDCLKNMVIRHIKIRFHNYCILVTSIFCGFN